MRRAATPRRTTTSASRAAATGDRTIKPGDPILVVKPKWCKLLLDGHKCLEIRSTTCKKKRGTCVWLSASGTGTVCGYVTFVESIELDQSAWEARADEHLVLSPTSLYKKTHGWRFKKPVRIADVPYAVKKGTVIWRKFEPLP